MAMGLFLKLNLIGEVYSILRNLLENFNTSFEPQIVGGVVEVSPLGCGSGRGNGARA
jgi:hypothetical protein